MTRGADYHEAFHDLLRSGLTIAPKGARYLGYTTDSVGTVHMHQCLTCRTTVAFEAEPGTWGHNGREIIANRAEVNQ